MKKIVKKAFKAIRLFLKSVGELLCADLIAYLFTQLINNVVFTATPLYRFRYEDLRMEICNLLAWVLFFLVMLIKPLLYHINRECATRHALGQLYLSNTLMTCAAYVAYIALARLTALKNLIFFGVSCKVYEDRLGVGSALVPLAAVAVFLFVMAAENLLLFFRAASTLPPARKTENTDR